MRIISEKIKKYLLDLIFPLQCLGCQKEGFWLCPDCLKKIEMVKKQTCPVCQKESPAGKTCPACRGRLSIDALLVAADYKNETVQKIIHSLKYKFAYSIKEALGQILTSFIKSNNISGLERYRILPVPLHKKRYKYRGFNQSEIIAEELGAVSGSKIIKENLIRCKNTAPQVKLKQKERNTNILGAFSLKNPLEISGQSVILIDDVYTTGSTMNEAAKVLKKAKAKEVIGLVIARG